MSNKKVENFVYISTGQLCDWGSYETKCLMALQGSEILRYTGLWISLNLPDTDQTHGGTYQRTGCKLLVPMNQITVALHKIVSKYKLQQSLKILKLPYW